jgi:hypothetical protein
VEQPEQLELARAQLVPSVDLTQPAHRVMTEQSQQQARARPPFLEQRRCWSLRTRLCGPDRHEAEYIETPG